MNILFIQNVILLLKFMRILSFMQ